MADAIKFIHAADLHLDQPLSGLFELPSHLRTILANAPYVAATKIFDLAIAERVDFVLLCGDLFDVESGTARAYAFLLNQFQRLAEKDIHVYWCGGKTDFPDRWPSSVGLPDNVLTVSSTIVEEIEHRRNGEKLCSIFASGYDEKRKDASELAAASSDTFNIAMAYGEFESASFSGKHIHYWALGGRHKPTKLEKSGTIAVYPGTPQGRSTKEPGVHSFKLCRIDTNGKLRVQSVESDDVRFMPQKLSIPENISTRDLKDMLSERALKIVNDCPEHLVLTRWFFNTDGPFNPRIRKPEWSAEILEWLRDEFGRGDRGLWSTEVTVEAPKNLPSEWYEEDTILGEFMRVVARHQSDDSLKLNVHQYMPQTFKGDSMASVGQIHREHRDQVLRKTAMVGIEYLAAHKELSESEGVAVIDDTPENIATKSIESMDIETIGVES